MCYVILAIYMLDSDQELSYNLSKNLLLLPRILKLIEDMVDDSNPLNREGRRIIRICHICITTVIQNFRVFVAGSSCHTWF